MNNRPNRSYRLLPYSVEWPRRFENIKRQLVHIFAENLIAVEHIGSTSVPGMLAKPQIDVLVVVKDLARVRLDCGLMEQAGFKSWGDYIKKEYPEEYFTKDNKGGVRLVSVHVMQLGNPEIEDYTIFRDYLRDNKRARDSYIAYKQFLLSKYSDRDYNSYGQGKVEFLEDLKAKAREWNKGR